MSYKIIVDSCCELPEEYLNDSHFEIVPLSLEVGDYHIMDDENFDQKIFLEKVASTDVCPKSACPSPERYLQAIKSDAEHIYIVTLSSKLSGSYNSAMLAKKMYEEEYSDKKIHVVDSESASVGETQIATKAQALEEAGKSFEEIVDCLEKFRDNMKTYFILDDLSTLRKNGRMSGVKELVASALSIKPIMASDKGNIVLRTQAVGMKKALSRMTDLIVTEMKGATDKILMISHCNAPERAEAVAKLLLEKASFVKVVILNTRGVSSMYANEGGFIVTL